MNISRLAAAALAFGLLAAGGGSFAKPPPRRGVLLVANSHAVLNRKGEGHIAIHDPETGAIIGSIPDGPPTVHELAISPDFRFVYAPVYGDGAVGGVGSNGSSIAIIDLAKRQVTGTVELGHGARPHHAVVGRDGTLFVTTELDHTVTMIDTRTRRIIGTLPTGQPESHNVAVSSDGRRAYTSNVFAGTVSFIDVRSRRLLKVLQITPAAKPATGKVSEWGVQRIALSSDNRTIYTCDWSATELVAIDTSRMEVSRRLKLPSSCYGMAFTPDGRRLLTANFIGNSVSVVDLRDFRVEQTLEGIGQPQVIVIPPDGRSAYVSCRTGVRICKIDLTNWTVSSFATSGLWPDGMVWAKVAPSL